MISCDFFYSELAKRGVKFFSGVPDSLLKNLCAYLFDHVAPDRHIIAANEGGAVALACGHHLATGNIPVVYMQNSGQGNAMNPLVSLADTEINSIPLLILVGWRGEPGITDAPQHAKQGKITLQFFEMLRMFYEVLPTEEDRAEESLDRLFDEMESNNSPAALVVRKNTFEPYCSVREETSGYSLTREQAIGAIVDALGPSDVVVSSTGKISRELFEWRSAMKGGHGSDFLTVGSMGHASQIALGISLSKRERQVFCLDGDGAAIMHLGALAITGTQAAENFKHVILNNGAHDSVGGQPTVGHSISFTDVALACHYRAASIARSQDEIPEKIAWLRFVGGPALLEVRVRKGARPELGRPTVGPLQNKKELMEFLSG